MRWADLDLERGEWLIPMYEERRIAARALGSRGRDDPHGEKGNGSGGREVRVPGIARRLQARAHDIGALYQGRFLKGDDLPGKTYQATISGVERVEVQEKDGSVRPKAALILQGWPLRLL